MNNHLLAQDTDKENNTIYILFTEYERIELVTLDKRKCVDAVKKRGNLGFGDFIEIWKDDQRIKYYQDYDQFINDSEVKPNEPQPTNRNP